MEELMILPYRVTRKQQNGQEPKSLAPVISEILQTGIGKNPESALPALQSHIDDSPSSSAESSTGGVTSMSTSLLIRLTKLSNKSPVTWSIKLLIDTVYPTDSLPGHVTSAMKSIDASRAQTVERIRPVVGD